MGHRNRSYQNCKYHMGICYEKTVYIPTYYHEQDYGIVIVSFAVNIVFCGIEIHFHRSMFHGNIRGSSRRDIYRNEL